MLVGTERANVARAAITATKKNFFMFAPKKNRIQKRSFKTAWMIKAITDLD
jgi:hypothetical protein